MRAVFFLLLLAAAAADVATAQQDTCTTADDGTATCTPPPPPPPGFDLVRANFSYAHPVDMGALLMDAPGLNPPRLLAKAARVIISHLELDMMRDVAKPMAETLRLLGVPVVREELGMKGQPGSNVTRTPDDIVITIGQSFMKTPAKPYIVFNLEQLEAEHFNERLHEAVVDADAIWEFSFANVNYWIDRGFTNVYYMPFSPMPEDLRPASEVVEAEETHAVFIGSTCNRREIIKQDYEEAGVNAKFHMRWNIWNDQRTKLVDDAAVVINMHCYPGAAQETLRLVGTLGRSACIVSEKSSDPLLDKLYGPCVELVPSAEEANGLPEIVKRTQYLLSNRTAREECRQRALPCLRSIKPTMFETLAQML